MDQKILNMIDFVVVVQLLCHADSLPCVMSDSLPPHGVQHARLPCPSPSPRACSNSCPWSWWCHPIISSSVFPFSSCFLSLPAPGFFPITGSLHQGPKYWSFSFSISPSNEHPGLISFRMDWLDLLAVQSTLKNLLQHSSSKASILWHSGFFTVQLSHPYVTIGKTIALTIRTFVGKVMALLCNTLSWFVSSFLPRSKHLLISLSEITICSDFGAPQNKICHYFHYFPIYLLWSDGTGCHDLSFLNVEL